MSPRDVIDVFVRKHSSSEEEYPLLLVRLIIAMDRTSEEGIDLGSERAAEIMHLETGIPVDQCLEHARDFIWSNCARN